ENSAELAANVGVDLGDLRRGRRQAAADRPYWLISYDGIGRENTVGQRGFKLARRDFERLTCLALIERLADARDCGKPGAVGGGRLPAHDLVGLTMFGPTLGMADDNAGATGIGKHFGRNIAGMGATFLPMAVLPAKTDLRRPHQAVKFADERSRRTYHDIAVKLDILEHAGHEPRLVQRCGGAVHLPISRHQRTWACTRHVPSPSQSRPSALAEQRFACEPQTSYPIMRASEQAHGTRKVLQCLMSSGERPKAG